MYVPETNPATFAEMKAFLDPLVTDGFFDSITYDDPDTPTKLSCTQNSNIILEITKPSTNAFTFQPFVAAGEAANSSHTINNMGVSFCFRASGGACLVLGQPSLARYTFVIAKTIENKAAFIVSMIPINYNFSNLLVTHYIASFGDDTTNYIYVNGYKVNQNGVTDRTILNTLPVVGSFGSADYFSTVYTRSSVQYAETGVQVIGGKKYACAYNYALSDD